MKQLLPKLTQSAYKGQNGRLGIIGGCLEYTGAPFYAALSQLKGGSDLSHIFCTKQAAIPIKSYSPEVITHPYLFSLNEEDQDLTADQIQAKVTKTLSSISEWQGALNSFVIGPGLGRDKCIQSYIGDIVGSFSKKQIIVLDADGLWFLPTEYQQQKDASKLYKFLILQDPQNHILTPNQVEFERLWSCFMVEKEDSNIQEKSHGQHNLKISSREDRIKAMQQLFQTYFDNIPGQSNENTKISVEQPVLSGDMHYIKMEDLSNIIVADAVQLSRKLNNINIIQKGLLDVITNGRDAYIVLERSSPKRCGGVGDTLSGLAGLYVYWAQKASMQNNQNSQLQGEIMNPTSERMNSQLVSPLLGCVLASVITRKSSFQAFEKYKMSLTAPNVIEQIGSSFWAVYSLIHPSEHQKGHKL